MADPLRAEVVHGRPDRRRAGGFPSVRHAVQARFSGGGEERLELRPPDADFGSTEPEAD